MAKVITYQEKLELVGQCIDLFEDFLEVRGIKLPNVEIDEAIEDGEDPEDLAIIYGSDYGELSEGLENIMTRWGLIEVSDF